MVKSIGIDPGDFAVKVVELDGSYRKTRLVSARSTTLGGEAAGHAVAVAGAARSALDDGLRGTVTLGHPCREAVLRVIELPFKGTDAIRKVVKAEIEGEIQTHSVDDMVVDFHEVGEGAEGGSRVLVASVPKPALRRQLEELSAVTIEPERIDLDTMALYRAAHWAGVFEPEEADEEAKGDAVAVPRVTALVDLGARSVKVLLFEGDRLIDMRVLRVGDAVILDEIARRIGVASADVRDAVHQSLLTGGDVRIEVAEALPAGEGAAEAVAAPRLRKVEVEHDAVAAASTGFLQRLSRELVRYLTSTGRSGQIQAVWITGGASRSPGMTEMLTAVFGMAPQPLDLLSKLQHDLDDAEVEALGPQLATAIGLALKPLGGPEGFELRQEDLVLARGFERIKFPLAIVCMVALLAMLVYGITLATKLRHLELEIGRTHPADNPKDPPVFHGMLHSVLGGRWFEEQRFFRFDMPKGKKDYGYRDLIAELEAAPVHERIKLVRDRLRKAVEVKQEQSGIYDDVKLESGFAVLVRWAEMLKRVEPELGRYLVLKVELNMDTKIRYLEFRIAFRGPDFRDRLGAIDRAMEAEYAMPDSPFVKLKDARANDELFTDSATSGVQGAFYKFRMGIKPVFDPFGPGANPLGAVPAAAPLDGDRLAMGGGK